jgi:hypothetical protein
MKHLSSAYAVASDSYSMMADKTSSPTGGRYCRPTSRACGLVFHKHSVAKKMAQQEGPLLGGDGIVDVDLRSIEIADEDIGDVPDENVDAVETLEVFLDPKRMVLKSRPHSSPLYTRFFESFSHRPGLCSPPPLQARIAQPRPA